MSDEKIQYDVHDYTPVNRYIDDQARLKRSASTWRYAKAAALILVATGILAVLLAWAYYLYKKPHRLVSLSEIEQKVINNEDRIINAERKLPEDDEVNTSTTSNILQGKINEKAFLKGKESWETKLDGLIWSQRTFPYQVKCLNWLREEYQSLNKSEKTEAHKIIDGTGCEALVN